MEHITEPYRLSLLDVLKKNLKAANRCTYLHRIIYICSHSFPNYKTVDEMYQKCINSINETYLDERISGLLLYYPDYFCIVLESSEHAIHSLLNHYLTDPVISKYVHKRKLLAVYHNINQRLFEEWIIYTDKPPTLLEKIDIDVDRQTATRYVYNCIKKLYGLIIRLRPIQIEEEAYSYDHDTKSSLVSFQSPARLRLTDFLPEYSLLDFLLKTEHTEQLDNYFLKHGDIPDVEVYQSMVWPASSSYIPFNVFDSFQEPIQDLPPRDRIKLKEIETPTSRKKETDQ